MNKLKALLVALVVAFGATQLMARTGDDQITGNFQVGGALFPLSDNVSQLGLSSRRWSDVQASSMTVNSLNLTDTLTLPAGSVTNAHLASDAASLNKVSAGAATSDGTNVTITGNVVMSDSGPKIDNTGDNNMIYASQGALILDSDSDNDGSAAFIFGTHNSAVQYMRIEEGGNVGIGTTDPLELLHVRGDDLSLLLNNPGTGSCYFHVEETGGIYQQACDVAQQFGNGTAASFTPQMTIETGGDVGVGTTDPTDDLHVARAGSVPSIKIEQENDDFNNDPALLLVTNYDGDSGGAGLSTIEFQAKDSVGNVEPFGLFRFASGSHTDGSEAASIRIEAITGGVLREYLKADGDTLSVVLNEEGVAIDTRMESDANPNMFFLDASAEAVGIGTGSPARALHISDVMRLEPRSAAPTSPALGDVYIDSDTNEFCFYDGSSWTGLKAAGTCA